MGTTGGARQSVWVKALTGSLAVLFVGGIVSQAAADAPEELPTAEPSAPSTAPATPTEPVPATPTEPVPAAESALAVLAGLPVKGRAPKTDYSREQFGRAWLDVDRNGCDTRNDMLGAQLTDIVYTNHVPCKVETGTLADPYTGSTLWFQRGQATSSQVQIDHIVALSDAWQKGAQQLDGGRRAALANDPLNLQATYGPTNAAKGASDAASWLPPNKSHRCLYVARQVGVKHKYGLWVTSAEHDAISRVLATCEGQRVPAAAFAAVVPAPPSPPPSPAPLSSGVPEAETGVSFENCAAVRAAGADPIRIGDPGFSTKFDGDGDGVGCE
ncbi:GmrSD restriction endonuclease domain-containing protein [Arthrobacter sp. KK5.5]|uniref:GmrSD restriction endonuclease domain-containing protein n=1 Tax=Arthrobacter sp. KK5.5 TaxID=3373084 RepID=UPI003EE47951